MKKGIRYKEVFTNRLSKLTSNVDNNTENTSNAVSGLQILIPMILILALFEYLYLRLFNRDSDFD